MQKQFVLLKKQFHSVKKDVKDVIIDPLWL